VSVRENGHFLFEINLNTKYMKKLSPEKVEHIIYALASFGVCVIIVAVCTLLWMISSILSQPI